MVKTAKILLEYTNPKSGKVGKVNFSLVEIKETISSSVFTNWYGLNSKDTPCVMILGNSFSHSLGSMIFDSKAMPIANSFPIFSRRKQKCGYYCWLPYLSDMIVKVFLRNSFSHCSGPLLFDIWTTWSATSHFTFEKETTSATQNST